MVKSYLEKCRQELLDIQIDLMNQIQRLDMMQKEKMEMIQYIESSEDKSYDSFIPQSIHIEMNRKSISRIENDIEQYQKEIEQLTERQNQVQFRMNEIDDVILHYRQKEEIVSDTMDQFMDMEHSYRRFFEFQESEFQNLANRLDVSLIHKIMGMRNRVELCNKVMDIDRDRCKIELQNMSDLLCNMISDISGLAFELSPMSLQNDGFTLILKKYVDYLSRMFHVNISISTNGKDEELSKDISIMIFRIIQRICTMILRCAHNKNIWIDMEYCDVIHLTIKFDSSDIHIIDGHTKDDIEDHRLELEMELLNKRIAIMSGKISIINTPDSKNCIDIKIPNNNPQCFT